MRKRNQGKEKAKGKRNEEGNGKESRGGRDWERKEIWKGKGKREELKREKYIRKETRKAKGKAYLFYSLLKGSRGLWSIETRKGNMKGEIHNKKKKEKERKGKGKGRKEVPLLFFAQRVQGLVEHRRRGN